MNYAPYEQPQLPKPNRTPLFIVLGGIVFVIAAAGAWVLAGLAAVRASLTDDGFTETKVTMHGPFTFGFDAKKGDETCAGTVTRFPGSMSREELCFSGSPGTLAAAPKPPPPSNRESLEKSLREHYADMGFDTFTCPDVANADTKTTCKLASTGGVEVGAIITRKTTGAAGDWDSWHIELDAPAVENAEKLGAKLAKSVAVSVASRHPGVVLDVDCGKGPLVFVAGKKITCQATSHDAKPLHATVTVENGDAGLSWTEKGM